MMNKPFVIAGREVGLNQPPFIIAELSGNHNQSLERALQLVDAAAESGAHAIKLQTYTPDSLTLPIKTGDFYIDDPNSLWYGKSLHDLYQVGMTPWEWHAQIIERAEKHDMIAFSTPFDEEAVDFLEALNTPCFKIASFENAHLPLIRKIASTGKPVIMSTGMATISELEASVNTLKENGCENIVLLKCTSTYPAEADNTNILTIPHMRELFKCEVGLSDHTLGVGVGVAATALGASVIEKHLTLNRADGGVDSAFSMEPAELESLVKETERAWKAMGQVSYGPTEAEQNSLRYRRSIYVSSDIEEGTVFSADNIRIVRPGFGLEPKFYDQLIGRRVNRALKAGDALRWEYIG